jgi:transposase
LWEKSLPREDKTAKAISCYGLLLPQQDQMPDQMLVRFCQGRPVSGVTTAFLGWTSQRLAAQGIRVLVLFWDNASWHISGEVRAWVREHNRQVKKTGQGVRFLVHRLPTRSPWLNRIEPKWVHGKRAVVEPARKLTAAELQQRLCDYYRTPRLPPLAQQVA